MMLNVMRTLCGPDFKPIEASFAHRKPVDVTPFRQFFRVPLYFDTEHYSLIFAPDWLQVRLPHGDQVFKEMLRRQFDALEANQRLVAFAEGADLARLSWGDRATAEPLVTRRQPRLVFGDVSLEPPPGAFLQATRRAEQAMRDAVASWIGDAKRVADLFAGLGTLTVGRPWRATLYESDKPSVAAVEAAGRRLGSGKLTAIHRDLFRNPLMAADLDVFDALVLDPPRAGAAAQSVELARSKVPRIVYGSCDPGSFARDAHTLLEGGYRLEKLLPVDQFLWSPHVELIALFGRAPLRSSRA